MQIRINKINIVINDRTDGNRNAALGKLKKAGIDLDDYTIVYNGLSAEQIPGRAPDGDGV